MGFGQRATLTFSAQTFGFALNFTTGVLVARGLGPAGKGEYQLTLVAAMMLLTLLDFGAPATLTYFVKCGRFSEPRMFRTAVRLSAVFGLLGALIGLSIVYGGLGGTIFGLEYSAALVLILVALPVSYLSTLLMNLLLGSGDLTAFNLLPIGTQASSLAVIAILYWMETLGVTALVLLHVLGNAAAVIFIVWRRRLVRRSQTVSSLSLDELRETAGYSLSTYAGNTVQYFNYRLDLIIVGVLLDVWAVGIYALAVGFAELLWMLSRPVATVLMPEVAGITCDTRRREVVGRSSAVTFLVTLLAASAMAALAPTCIPLIYGEEFRDAVLPLLLLLPGAVVFCLTNVQAAFLAGVGKARLNAVASAVSLCVTIALDLLLIPRWGILGAAVATSSSYTVATLLTLHFARRHTGSSVREMLRPPPLHELLQLARTWNGAWRRATHP